MSGFDSAAVLVGVWATLERALERGALVLIDDVRERRYNGRVAVSGGGQFLLGIGVHAIALSLFERRL
jgi:hypothetical protein